jgi:lipopolysaccharide biosynthesis glycosyltransferase
MTDKCFTVCFDQNYIEPALLTAFELLQNGAIPLYLVYIENEDDSAESLAILQAFEARVGGDGLRMIKVKNNVFDKFEKYHFTNSILYKVLIPSIVEHDYVINIDAGFLLGEKYAEFISALDLCLTQSYPSDFVVGAFCGASEEELPAHLRRHPYHPRYPTGGVLLFNRKKYQAGDFYTRLVRTYFTYKNELVWAEQDLLCLLLVAEELQELPMKSTVLIEQLGVEGLLKNARSEAWSKDFSLYKIAGTLKPWKYWVLDPRKKFYLVRRHALTQHLDLDGYRVTRDNRHAVNHVPLQQQFLELQERMAL